MYEKKTITHDIYEKIFVCFCIPLLLEWEAFQKNPEFRKRRNKDEQND